MKKLKILVPKFCDEEIIRAQDLNAKNLLKHFSHPHLQWHAFSSKTIDKNVKNKENVKIIKFKDIAPCSYFHVSGVKRNVFKKMLYRIKIFMEYNKDYDAIFYPGWKRYELMALITRLKFRKDLPIIATAESLFGNDKHAAVLSQKYGHPVYTLNDTSKFKLYKYASNIIAVSPLMRDFVHMFISKNCTYIPLGIDTLLFNEKTPITERPLRIINVGRLRKEKRPDLFVKIAKEFPDVEFIWYGDGPMKKEITDYIALKNILNVKLYPSISQPNLAEALNTAKLFLSTSFSEVFPKVTLEAQACGTPVISFGYYRSPIVKHEETGLVAWSLEEMITQIRHLLYDNTRLQEYSKASIENAQRYDWNRISPLWEEYIKNQIES